MATLYHCTQGHLWEDLLDGPSIVDGQIRCPVCGRGSQPCPPPAQESGQTALLPPVAKAAAGVLANTGPTRMMTSLPPTDPILSSDTPLPSSKALATVMKPALANAPPSSDGADIEVATPPRGPSKPTDRTSEVEVAPYFPPPGELTRSVDATPPVRQVGRGTAREDRRHKTDTPSTKVRPEIPGYEMLDELGRGGMGVVYKARQKGLNRLVALKMILAGSAADERDRARFKTEAEAIARLQHPNIVQIFEVGDHAGSGWFSLEFVDGGSLADRLKGEALPVHESARLVETLARAVHFAHQHGVVHRDLKPANVLLQKEGQKEGSGEVDRLQKKAAGQPLSSSAVAAVSQMTPKITDFGLAKTLDTDIHHTRSGMVVGTPGYMAPEQATGGEGVGPATDTYSLGVILYQMVTGKLPFVGETPMEVMLKLTQDEPPRPRKWQPKLAADLETIILKCLEKDPRRRYASSLDLAEDLRRFLAHEPILARPVQTFERTVRWVRRHPAIAAMLGVIVLSGAGLLTTFAVYERGEKARRIRDREEVLAAYHQARGLRGNDKLTYATWQSVRDRLEDPVRRVRKDATLADVADRVEKLFAEAEGHLEVGKAVGAFTKERTDTLFEATLALGSASPSRLKATRDKIESALKTVGASRSAAPKFSDYYSDEQKDEIKQGCFELMLVLADTLAQPLPNQSPAERVANANEALEVLDQAGKLELGTNPGDKVKLGETHGFHLRRARLLAQAGRGGDATRELALAEQRPAKSELDFYLLGMDHYRDNKVDEAEEKFSLVLHKNPKHFWAKFYQALCHVRLGKHLIAARDSLTSCLKDQPDEPCIYLLRALVHGQLGDHRKAIDDFKVAEEGLKKQEPQDREMLYALYNNRAVTLLGAKQLEAAEDELKAIKEVEEAFQANVTLSQVYRQWSQKEREKNPELAARYLDKGLEQLDIGLRKAAKLAEKQKLDAGTMMLLRRLRYALNVEGKNRQAALEDLNSVIALGEFNPEARARAFRDRGHWFYRDKKYAEALSEYDKALKLKDDTDLERWRGEVLLRVTPPRYGDAIAAYTRHVEGWKGPGSVKRNVFRGRAFARMKMSPPQYQEAILDFTQALGLKPEVENRTGEAKTDEATIVSELHLQRGQAYLGSKLLEQAVKDFDTVLKGGVPAHVRTAHQGRALVRLQLGQYREAARDAEEVVKLAEQPGAKDVVEGLYGAACVIAQVAGQIEPVREKDGSSSLGTKRAAQSERRRYQDRAIALLQKALATMPREDQAAFWQNKVKKEIALRPLSLHEAYVRLDRRYTLN